MDTTLQGIPCHIDDILVSGKDDEEHLANLAQVFQRLQQHGLWLKKGKCYFMEPSVEYLGHLIDVERLHTTVDKLKAIVEAPAPRNVSELRSFWSLLNYYGKFLPNLSTLLYSLNCLLQHDCKWKWTTEWAKAFQQAKDALTSSQVLFHYNPTLPIKLAADASAYGIGAVISHVLPDGNEKPIALHPEHLCKLNVITLKLRKKPLP